MRALVLVVALVGAAATLLPAAEAVPPGWTASEPLTRSLVFNGQGNDLAVYDGTSGEKQILIPHVVDPDDPDDHGRDLNAQICFTEIGGQIYFIAGEDSGQSDGGPDPEGSPGWGWFRLTGDTVGELGWQQVGKLRPTWTQEGQAENYGCGFLPADDPAEARLVTTDVGAQLPHEPASGQLLVWFQNPGGGFADATGPGHWTNVDNELDQNYCKIDTSIGTAGQSTVHDGWVYVASNRPGPNGPGGIYRYEIADFPTDNGCAGHGNQADLVSAGVVTRELWLPSDAFVLTPSAAIPSGRTFQGLDTWYVSSVFTGVIAEYADTGVARVHVRNIVEPPGGGSPIAQIDDIPNESGLPVNDGGTPYGMGLTKNGDLWYADLGIQGPGPASGHGSVQRITFDAAGNAQRLIVDDFELDYPDGIGILDIDEVRTVTGDTVTGHSKPDSDSDCDDWRMYGRTGSRAFSVPDACDSDIAATSAATLVPKWAFKTAKTVTASPAVAGGKVFVGDWSGTMYALDAETGDELWTFEAPAAPGAAFGPIVSSAAVTRITGGGPPRDLVIFGAGPRLFALRASNGSIAWQRDFSSRIDDPETPAEDPEEIPDPDTPVEIESSPVVWRGTVYVGIDNHNTPGTGVRGGLLALDVTSGADKWKFEPELDNGDAGCGGVWSSPVVNGTDGLVYLATANCPRGGFEWTPHTEAVTALDAVTGDVKWSFQPHTANLKDWDFGATPNLFEIGGERVLGAGNKDGWYYLLDARTGLPQWKTKLADGGDVNDNFAIGGFLGSPAAHNGNVYGATAIGGAPYYHSLDGTTGDIRWRGAQAPSYGASAAVNDVVFAGALDNLLRAYHTATGAVLWSAPLFGPISSGPAIAGDSIYVGSGTSSSDACRKEFGEEFNQACVDFFDEAVGSTGGIHAFELATSLLP